MIKLWSNGGGGGGAPWWTFWSAGITNTIGPAMGIEALKYISYPAQVIYFFPFSFIKFWFLAAFSIAIPMGIAKKWGGW